MAFRGGLATQQDVQTSLDPVAAAITDLTMITIGWQQISPTDSSGNKLPYTTQGANGGFGSSAATLKLETHLRIVGKASGLKRAVLAIRAGNSSPKHLIGAPVGDADFPLGLVGTMGANVVRQAFSQQQGTNSVRAFMAPEYWGTGFATYKAEELAMLQYVTTRLKSQFVDNVNNIGPTLWDVIDVVRMGGLNRGTDEVRMPTQWPTLLMGSAKGVGSPDATSSLPVTIGWKQWEDAGATNALIRQAIADITALWRDPTTFQGKLLTFAPTNAGAGDGALPPFGPNGKYPCAVLDPAATAAYNPGGGAQGATGNPGTFVFANKFPTGHSFADLRDPAAFGGLPQQVWVTDDHGSQLITYTTLDAVNRRVSGSTGGAGSHTLLGDPGIAANIASAALVTMGAVTTVLKLTGTTGPNAFLNWKDPMICLVLGATGPLAFMNGNIYTVRGVGSGTYYTGVGPGAAVDPATNNAVTLQDQAGGLVTVSTVAGATFGTMLLLPLTVGSLNDGSGIPYDPNMRLAISDLSAFGHGAMVMDTGYQAPDTKDGTAFGAGDGTLLTDSPQLKWVRDNFPGLLCGVQTSQGLYGTDGVTASVTKTTAAGTNVTTVPLNQAAGPPGGGTFTAVVGGKAVIVTAGANTTSWTVPAGVTFANGARVTWSREYDKVVDQMISDGSLYYCEVWSQVNENSNTERARATLAAWNASEGGTVATVLTRQPIDPAGEAPVYGACDAAGNLVLPGPTTFLHFKNTNGAIRNVTMNDPSSVKPTGANQFDPDIVKPIPATTGDIMVAVPARFADPADGFAHITYDAVTGLVVAALFL